MSSTLNGQVAIVTGAGRGIGGEIALTFARAGAEVVLAVRTCTQLHELGDLITSEGGVAMPVRTDVSDHDSVAKLVANTMARFGRIDILVNNAAGANYISSLVLSDDARWKKMFDVNVFGVCLCTKAVLRAHDSRQVGKCLSLHFLGSIPLVRWVRSTPDQRTPRNTTSSAVCNSRRSSWSTTKKSAILA